MECPVRSHVTLGDVGRPQALLSVASGSAARIRRPASAHRRAGVGSWCTEVPSKPAPRHPTPIGINVEALSELQANEPDHTRLRRAVGAGPLAVRPGGPSMHRARARCSSATSAPEASMVEVRGLINWAACRDRGGRGRLGGGDMMRSTTASSAAPIMLGSRPPGSQVIQSVVSGDIGVS